MDTDPDLSSGLIDQKSGRSPFVLIGTKSLFPRNKGTCYRQGPLFARNVRDHLILIGGHITLRSMKLMKCLLTEVDSFNYNNQFHFKNCAPTNNGEEKLALKGRKPPKMLKWKVWNLTYEILVSSICNKKTQSHKNAKEFCKGGSPVSIWFISTLLDHSLGHLALQLIKNTWASSLLRHLVCLPIINTDLTTPKKSKLLHVSTSSQVIVYLGRSKVEPQGRQ
ncbi:hypothetical protein LguiB_009632 [Lonicera macranthoides]